MPMIKHASRKIVSLQYSFFRLSLGANRYLGFIFLILIFNLNACGAKDMIHQIKAPWIETEEIPSDFKDETQSQLKKVVMDYLQGDWEIKDARYFLTLKRPKWDAVRGFVLNQISFERYHKQIPLEFDDASPGMVAIFDYGLVFRKRIAVAMLNDPINGQWLLGYFSLEK